MLRRIFVMLLIFASVLLLGAASQPRPIAQPKPLLFYVTAEWCGTCKTMERDVIPKIERQRVVVLKVDVDDRPALAKSLTHGGPVPQLVLYRPDEVVVGARSAAWVNKWLATRVDGKVEKDGRTGLGHDSDR